jgi:hypothetical protein
MPRRSVVTWDSGALGRSDSVGLGRSCPWTLRERWTLRLPETLGHLDSARNLVSGL